MIIQVKGSQYPDCSLTTKASAPDVLVRAVKHPFNGLLELYSKVEGPLSTVLGFISPTPLIFLQLYSCWDCLIFYRCLRTNSYLDGMLSVYPFSKSFAFCHFLLQFLWKWCFTYKGALSKVAGWIGKTLLFFLIHTILNEFLFVEKQNNLTGLKIKERTTAGIWSCTWKNREITAAL